MLLTELLQLHEPGPDSGMCYICGTQTESGWAQAPSEAFTAWASVYGGNVMCPACRPLVKRGEFRHRSWLATQAGVEFTEKGKREFIWQALLSPPEPPFAIYLTRAGQKQGALGLLRYVSESQERYWVGVEWLDRPVLMEREVAIAHAELVEKLRARKLPKAVLLSGQYGANHYKRALEEDWIEDLDEARRWVGNPQWEVIIHAHVDGTRAAGD